MHLRTPFQSPKSIEEIELKIKIAENEKDFLASHTLAERRQQIILEQNNQLLDLSITVSNLEEIHYALQKGSSPPLAFIPEFSDFTFSAHLPTDPPATINYSIPDPKNILELKLKVAEAEHVVLVQQLITYKRGLIIQEQIKEILTLEDQMLHLKRENAKRSTELALMSDQLAALPLLEFNGVDLVNDELTFKMTKVDDAKKEVAPTVDMPKIEVGSNPLTWFNKILGMKAAHDQTNMPASPKQPRLNSPAG